MTERATVVVERTFGEPVEFETLQSAENAVSWCLEQHDVRPLRSYLSLDRRRMLCIYEAPDAESVRLTQDRAGLTYVRVWSASLLPGPTASGSELAAQGGFATVVVEREVPPGTTLEDVRGLVSSSPPCFELHQARLLVSHLSRDLRRMMCIFSAPDAESTRTANVQGGFSFVRAWTATVHTG
jgi:hypothetical protein